MIRILTIDSERGSAERLGYDIIDDLETVDHYHDDIIIRWGNSGYVYDLLSRGVEFPKVINPRSAIRQNCRKNEALLRFSEVVNTPKVWLEDEEVPDNQLAVYRYREHSGGSGFSVKRGPFIVEEDHYATEWLATPTELRVWFCGDKTMCGTRVKLPSQQLDKYPCRSLWGYKFEKRVPISLHEDTMKAAKAIGLEFGAADVLLHKGKYYFIELNSAPTIDKQVIEDFYVKNMQLLISKKYPGYK
jgi:hypothetical protein